MNDLNTESIARFGVDPGWGFGKRFETRWSDIDPFGHVSNRAYLIWCEEARNAYIAALGVPPLSLDTPGPVLKDIGFTFDRALKHGTEVIVTARVSWVRTTSFRMEYAVWDGAVAGSGHAICVWLLNATGEKIAVSEQMRERVIELDGSHRRQCQELCQETVL